MKIDTTTLKHRARQLFCVIFAGLGLSGVVFAAGNPLPQPQTWVECEKFNGVVTKAMFKPIGEAFDELYAGGNGFLDGAPLISDAGPNHGNYNGGRWHLNLLKEDVNPDKYADTCTAGELDPDDFMSTTIYFECPLFPRRGNN